MTQTRNLRFVGALLAVVALPLYALAHPRLVSATPAANSRVPAPPATLRLTFQEALEPAMSRITLTDATSHAVSLAPVTADPADAKTLVATPKSSLAPGRYTVTWQAAGADGHPMRGTYAFEVVPRTAP